MVQYVLPKDAADFLCAYIYHTSACPLCPYMFGSPSSALVGAVLWKAMFSSLLWCPILQDCLAQWFQPLLFPPSLNPKELLSLDIVAYFSATKYIIHSLSCNDINCMFISSDPYFYFKTFFFHTFIKSKQYLIVMLGCVPGPEVNHCEQRFDYNHVGPGPRWRK